MHDPMMVAFDIPSYRTRQRWPWLPCLVTIWHVDPERDGSDDSCGHAYQWRKTTPQEDAIAEVLWAGATIFDNRPHWNKDGGTKEHRWFQKLQAAWTENRRRRTFWRINKRWHVWHWHLQIHPLQALRRKLLTRCQKCGRGFRRSEPVFGGGWSSPPRRWFESLRGERECWHHDCHPAMNVQQSEAATP